MEKTEKMNLRFVRFKNADSKSGGSCNFPGHPDNRRNEKCKEEFLLWRKQKARKISWKKGQPGAPLGLPT